jgi:hypothetical protein
MDTDIIVADLVFMCIIRSSRLLCDIVDISLEVLRLIVSLQVPCSSYYALPSVLVVTLTSGKPETFHS